MLETFFKTLFKLVMALGLITAVLAVIKYLDDQRADYIEIYNDDDDLDEELFT